MKSLLITLTICPLLFAGNKNASASAATYSAADVKAAADEKRAHAGAHDRSATASHSTAATLQKFPVIAPGNFSTKDELDAYIKQNMELLTKHAKSLQAVLHTKISNAVYQDNWKQHLPQLLATLELHGVNDSPKDLYNIIDEYATSGNDVPYRILSTALASFSAEELGGLTINQFIEAESKAFENAYNTLRDTVRLQVGDAFEDSLSDDSDLGAREGVNEYEQKLYSDIGLNIDGDGPIPEVSPFSRWLTCRTCQARFKPGWNHSYYHNWCRFKKELDLNEPIDEKDASKRDQILYARILNSINLASRKAVTSWHKASGWRSPEAVPVNNAFSAWELFDGIRQSITQQTAVWEMFQNQYETFEADQAAHHRDVINAIQETLPHVPEKLVNIIGTYINDIDNGDTDEEAESGSEESNPESDKE